MLFSPKHLTSNTLGSWREWPMSDSPFSCTAIIWATSTCRVRVMATASAAFRKLASSLWPAREGQDSGGPRQYLVIGRGSAASEWCPPCADQQQLRSRCIVHVMSCLVP
ncbi:hypothetical protein N658DRAFT_122848 [Parathielavia hyrcaniae]|uniref:Uncharacterized protein n=1 Tax=Parathielavia hyrcaniae TaxID=113614 RepID=A0AAN6Q8G9_9PEZI|nr:hypothetical protein N658DRAFT_122848 [Parathielavia hyrcaniae]